MNFRKPKRSTPYPVTILREPESQSGISLLTKQTQNLTALGTVGQTRLPPGGDLIRSVRLKFTVLLVEGREGVCPSACFTVHNPREIGYAQKLPINAIS
jgi:hypothetical protein